MRVIFLDIDGVLAINSRDRDEYGAAFHPHLVKNLDRVINDTGAKIVISSTWRMSGLSVMQDMWKKRSLPGEVIDITVDLTFMNKYGTLEYYQAGERGREIQEWIDLHPEITSYVIIDDDNDMLGCQMDNFIQTSNNYKSLDSIEGYGLTSECADKAILILNRK